jgi:two-component system OmpR family response regulator
MRILLIEDDPMIGAGVTQALTDAAHAVDWVQKGEFGLSALSTSNYDVLLLDLGLDSMSGFDVLRALRKDNAALPVLVLTAMQKIDTRVDVLDLGADDYLVKPFDPRELLARIRAVVRRKGGSGAPVLVCGELAIDPASHEAEFRSARCRLSAREFSLLEALVRRPGSIVSKGELEERIYGWSQDVDSNTVEVLVYGLRKKLGANVIRTVRGVGYMVDARP